MFKLASDFKLTDDQSQAVGALSKGIMAKKKDQVLLGVTGSGKTFTIANIIKKTNRPALIISHNKTLAGQLYQEMRDFFPENAVSYFVSYYDFYQPEAYIPSSDTYIEKEAQINEVIDKLRLATTSNIMTRPDAIVVASVSCIYNIGSPVEYGKFIADLKVEASVDVKDIAKRLIELQYERSEFDFKRGTFRLRGTTIDIYPAYDDIGVRIEVEEDVITGIHFFDPLTGTKSKQIATEVIIYPAKHYLADPTLVEEVSQVIRRDVHAEYEALRAQHKTIEAERLLKKVNYDLEMIREVGYVNGIENYSRYFDNRNPGDPPHSLLDYFNHSYGDKWTVFIDESHMTIPQIRGMYHGDFSRKKNLVEYGFRMKAAFDNRPLKFHEFDALVPRYVYVSATPDEWEVERAGGQIVQQLVRPTGIVDPIVEVRPSANEVQDVLTEIQKHIARHERVLVTTLTKRIAEDLTAHLVEKGVAALYLHSDIKTLERSQILHKLRTKQCDVLVGINLLREGLDIPEVTLVAILDADTEGFLRSKTALIQTMGRAARNVNGRVIIYADTMTKSLQSALSEIDRRRAYQLSYNAKHGITPRTIVKKIKEGITDDDGGTISADMLSYTALGEYLTEIDTQAMTPYDKKKLIGTLQKKMKQAARDMRFEQAISIRDTIRRIEKS